MTSKKTQTWRRGAAVTVVGAALAFGSVLGPAPIASADVIGQLACEYGTAPGAGQISRLLNQSIALSAQGFRPSASNLGEVSAALDSRPNTTPLIAALQNVVASQENTRTLAQAAAAGAGPSSSMTVNQGNPGYDMSDPFGTDPFPQNDPFPNQVVLGGGVDINPGGQNYTIGNGGELVVPTGC